MMCIPKRLVRLAANLVMCGRVHEQHANQHDVSRYTAGLGIEDFYGGFRSDLGYLNVEEAAERIVLVPYLVQVNFHTLGLVYTTYLT